MRPRPPDIPGAADLAHPDALGNETLYSRSLRIGRFELGHLLACARVVAEGIPCA